MRWARKQLGSASLSARFLLCGADLAIKCATHSGSNVGRKIRGSSVIAVHTYGVSRFSKPRTPATLNPPMCPRVHGEVWTAEAATSYGRIPRAAKIGAE